MIITNEKAKDVLAVMRRIEEGDIKSLSAPDLAEALAYMKIISENVEKTEKLIKSEFKKRDIKTVYTFPNITKKVLLKEGTWKTAVDSEMLHIGLKNDHLGRVFYGCVKVNLTDLAGAGADKHEQQRIDTVLNRVRKSDQGDDYYSVIKMTKEELKEVTK